MSFLSYFRPAHHHHRRQKHRRCDCHMPCGRILCGITSFFVLIAIIIFLIFIILRPSKPEFVLKGITVYSLNVSPSPTDTISITIQITLVSQNHNERISIQFREGEVFASYHGEQVTRSTSLTSTYQRHNDITVWSPFMYGNEVPISPESANALREEVTFGELLFVVRVIGKVKWKVGTWTSGTYHLSVDCPTIINSNDLNITSNTTGVATVFGVSQGCNVEV